MSEPSKKKLDMDGCQKFIDAIRSITDNPTMDKQDCEEWIDRLTNLLHRNREVKSDILGIIGR